MEFSDSTTVILAVAVYQIEKERTGKAISFFSKMLSQAAHQLRLVVNV